MGLKTAKIFINLNPWKRPSEPEWVDALLKAEAPGLVLVKHPNIKNYYVIHQTITGFKVAPGGFTKLAPAVEAHAKIAKLTDWSVIKTAEFKGAEKEKMAEVGRNIADICRTTPSHNFN